MSESLYGVEIGVDGAPPGSASSQTAEEKKHDDARFYGMYAVHSEPAPVPAVSDGKSAVAVGYGLYAGAAPSADVGAPASAPMAVRSIYGMYESQLEASNPVIRDVLGQASAIAAKKADEPLSLDKSDKGESGSATAASGSVDWTAQFQKALELPMATAEQESTRANAIRSVVKDFVEAAARIGKTVIEEVGVPNEKKKIKPSSKFGGIAGGVKYLENNIIFKFAVDSSGVYGHSDDNAMKAANHELRGLSTILAANIPGLMVPLMALIDYNGYRLVATSLLPISGSKSLVYGTADGGFTVLNSHPELDAKLRVLATTLNIKSHLSGGVDRATGKLNPSACTLVHTCADLEGHLTADGRMFLVDAHRLFPPTHWGTRKPLPGEQLYNLFRPEFVMTYSKPLCSDAFTGFALVDGATHNCEIVEATGHLRDVTIPKFALYLARKFNGLEQSLSLSEEAHRFGVNVRMLGLVRQHLFNLICHYDGRLSAEADGGDKDSKDGKGAKDGNDGDGKSSQFPQLSDADRDELISNAYSLSTSVLMEMIARYLKCVLRAVMRATPDRAVRNTALQRFFWYLDADRTHWAWMKPGLCEKFEGALTEFEMTDTVNLRRRVDIFWIENRVQIALGIRILKKSEFEKLGEVKEQTAVVSSLDDDADDAVHAKVRTKMKKAAKGGMDDFAFDHVSVKSAPSRDFGPKPGPATPSRPVMPKQKHRMDALDDFRRPVSESKSSNRVVKEEKTPRMQKEEKRTERSFKERKSDKKQRYQESEEEVFKPSQDLFGDIELSESSEAPRSAAPAPVPATNKRSQYDGEEAHGEDSGSGSDGGNDDDALNDADEDGGSSRYARDTDMMKVAPPSRGENVIHMKAAPLDFLASERTESISPARKLVPPPPPRAVESKNSTTTTFSAAAAAGVSVNVLSAAEAREVERLAASLGADRELARLRTEAEAGLSAKPPPAVAPAEPAPSAAPASLAPAGIAAAATVLALQAAPAAAAQSALVSRNESFSMKAAPDHFVSMKVMQPMRKVATLPMEQIAPKRAAPSVSAKVDPPATAARSPVPASASAQSEAAYDLPLEDTKAAPAPQAPSAPQSAAAAAAASPAPAKSAVLAAAAQVDAKEADARKQRSLPSYAAPSADSIASKLAYEPTWNVDMVQLDIKMSPLFVVSRDIGYALFRQAKGTSGKAAVALCEKACAQFESVYRTRPNDAVTLAIWAECLAYNAALHAHFPAQATQLYDAAMDKFAQAVQISCTMRDRLAERVKAAESASAAASAASGPAAAAPAAAAPATLSLAGVPAYKGWGTAQLQQAVALLIAICNPYSASDVRMKRIPLLATQANALLDSACDKFAAAVKEVPRDAEALFLWGCALALRGAHVASQPESFSLEAKVARAMDAPRAGSNAVLAITLLRSAEVKLLEAQALWRETKDSTAFLSSAADSLPRSLARTLTQLAVALDSWQRGGSGGAGAALGGGDAAAAADYSATSELRALSAPSLAGRAVEIYRSIAAAAGVHLKSDQVLGPTSSRTIAAHDSAASTAAKPLLPSDFCTEWGNALRVQGVLAAQIAQSDRSSEDVKAASALAVLSFRLSLECHELAALRRQAEAAGHHDTTVAVAGLSVPVTQWSALASWAQTAQAWIDSTVITSSTALMMQKIAAERLKESRDAEALWRRTAGVFVFRRIRYGNRASSPDTASSQFARKIYKWAFFVEAVDGSPLDFVKSVTIDLHPSFAKPRVVLEKQPFVLEGAGYGAFQTQLHFAFKAPFEKTEFSLLHMLSLNEGGASKEIDFELSVQ